MTTHTLCKYSGLRSLLTFLAGGVLATGDGHWSSCLVSGVGRSRRRWTSVSAYRRRRGFFGIGHASTPDWSGDKAEREREGELRVRSQGQICGVKVKPKPTVPAIPFSFGDFRYPRESRYRSSHSVCPSALCLVLVDRLLLVSVNPSLMLLSVALPTAF